MLTRPNNFFKKNKKLPENLQQMSKEYFSFYVKDGWGRKLIYQKNNNQEYIIKSLGADVKTSKDDIQFIVNASSGSIGFRQNINHPGNQ